MDSTGNYNTMLSWIFRRALAAEDIVLGQKILDDHGVEAGLAKHICKAMQ